jgi:hypothetical protein
MSASRLARALALGRVTNNVTAISYFEHFLFEAWMRLQLRTQTGLEVIRVQVLFCVGALHLKHHNNIFIDNTPRKRPKDVGLVLVLCRRASMG